MSSADCCVATAAPPPPPPPPGYLCIGRERVRCSAQLTAGVWCSQAGIGPRARSASDANVLRRKGHLKEQVPPRCASEPQGSTPEAEAEAGVEAPLQATFDCRTMPSTLGKLGYWVIA